MMSLRPVHAGSGYQYLLRSVATNDAYDSSSEEAVESNNLSGYYQAKGTPPGRWLGRGVATLASRSCVDGEEITADQMACLWGEGLHPDSLDRMKQGESIDKCQLGKRFPTYTGKDKALIELKKEEEKFKKENKRLPTEAERSELVVETCRPFFEKETGQINASGAHVVAWVNKRREAVKQAVAGYDFTFSPPKSVSVVWALGDEETANLIAACHHEAVEEAISWADKHVVRTRQGSGGIAQVETNGLIAAQFTHFDTRAGDPDLHTHVLLSNKVQRQDGKWTSLDGQPLFMHHHNISTRYDKILMDKLRERLGVEFEERNHSNTMQPTWEINTISDELVEMFSTRRRNAKPVFDRLVEQFTQSKRRAPGKRETKELWQAAILETRDAKKAAQSLRDLRAGWATAVLNSKNGEEFQREVARTLNRDDTEHLTPPTPEDDEYQEWVSRIARDAVDKVTDERSEMRFHHVETAITSALRPYFFHDSSEFQSYHSDICRYAYREVCLNIRPDDDVLELPSELIRNGKAIDYRIGQERFTTQEILDAEFHVLQATAELTPFVAQNKTIDSVLQKHTRKEGWSLNTGQEALARHLLTTGTLVATGVGPAGTGKTTSMNVVAKVWKKEGHNVIGLAPSAQAAQVLSNEIGVDAYTIDKLTHTWLGRNEHKPAHSVNALPVKIHKGDMILVDEAGMASTKNLNAVVEIAERTGAIVRLIGDPLQLDAVENGGLFSTLTTMAPTAELTDVMRFSKGKDSEQSQASLKLRQGDTKACEFYARRRWVRGGSREEMLSDAVAAYIKDTEKGLTSLVVASTNDDVNAMNEIIRQFRIEKGLVNTNEHIVLAHGDIASPGDIIITRKNQQLPTQQTVLNGQLWKLKKINADGSLVVRDIKTNRRVVLPAAYVHENTHLGYAATVHRSQGATVDTTHAVIDHRVDRAGLYVALTRGKISNRVYAVVEPYLDEEAEEQHYHMAGDSEAPTAMNVFKAAVRRDRRQQSALDAIAEEVDNVYGNERVGTLYRHARELVVTAYAEQVLSAFVDELPPMGDDDVQKLRTTLERLIDSGVDPSKTLTDDTAHLEGAKSLVSVVCWRLNKRRPHEHDSYATLPVKARRLASRELETWMAHASRQLQSYRERTNLRDFVPSSAEELIEKMEQQAHSRFIGQSHQRQQRQKEPTHTRGFTK